MTEGSAPKPAILVSACLVGIECNHLGRANTSFDVLSLRDACRLVPVCPETLGGLATPRVCAARDGDRVVTEQGEDVTAAFARGAAAAVAMAVAIGARHAVLKARSPSCDCRTGVTAQALVAAGVRVESEEDVAARTIAGRDTGA